MMEKIMEQLSYLYGVIENSLDISPVKRSSLFVDTALRQSIGGYNDVPNNRWKFWKPTPIRSVRRLAFDKDYYTCSYFDFEKIRRLNINELVTYQPQVFDCDDISTLFKSFVSLVCGLNNVGIVIDYSGRHAYNVVILSNGVVKFYEPQTNEYIRLSNTGEYQLKQGVVLL